MNPGSIHSAIAKSVEYARTHDNPILAGDLEAAGRRIAAVLKAGDALIESAAPHPTNPDLYCVTVACFEQLSVANRDAGGAA